VYSFWFREAARALIVEGVSSTGGTWALMGEFRDETSFRSIAIGMTVCGESSIAASAAAESISLRGIFGISSRGCANERFMPGGGEFESSISEDIALWESARLILAKGCGSTLTKCW